MLANDVQETPAKGRHLLDGSPFGYDAHKGKLSGLIIHWSQDRSLPGPQLFPQVMCYIRTPQVIPREPIEPLVSALCLPAPSARPTVCTVCPCVAPPLVRPPNQAVRQPVPSLLHTSISINFRRRPGVFVIGRGHFPGRGADDRRRGHRTSTRSPCPRETRASPRRRRRSSATTLRPSLLPLLRAGRVRSDGLRQQLVQLLLILSAESGKR